MKSDWYANMDMVQVMKVQLSYNNIISNIRGTKWPNLNVSQLVFAQSNEARCSVENEDVVGAAPTGDAPTTSEWLTILLPTNVHLILETLRYLVLL